MNEIKRKQYNKGKYMDKQVEVIQEQSDNSEELIGNEYDVEKLTKINHELILKNTELKQKNEELSELLKSKDAAFLESRLVMTYSYLRRIKLLLSGIHKKDDFSNYEFNYDRTKKLDKAKALLSDVFSSSYTLRYRGPKVKYRKIQLPSMPVEIAKQEIGLEDIIKTVKLSEIRSYIEELMKLYPDNYPGKELLQSQYNDVIMDYLRVASIGIIDDINFKQVYVSNEAEIDGQSIIEDFQTDMSIQNDLLTKENASLRKTISSLRHKLSSIRRETENNITQPGQFI